MTIYDSNFIYANRTSEEFGVILCDIGTVNTESNDEESQIITSTTPFIDTWNFHGLEKTAPLQYKLTICNKDGSFIDSYKERDLKKWLCKKKRFWLQIDQDDMYDIFYNCIFINPRKISIGKYSGGMTFDVICDSGHAWSSLKQKTYTTSSGTLTFNLNNSNDYDEYELKPLFEITPLINGNLSITNNTTNNTLTLNNCVTSESIIIDNLKNIIKSSSGRVLLDDWNKKFIYLKNGINNITLTGNFSIKISYRLPIRVGG
jgi:phage-related protein